MKNDTIIRYVRDKKNRKIGMLVAKEYYDKCDDIVVVEIGWSLCRPGDIFSRELGYNRAIENLGKPIPPSLKWDVKKFRVQCFVYFQKAKDIQNLDVMEGGLQARKPRDGITRNSGHRHGCENLGGSFECTCRELAKAEEKVNKEPEMVALG